MNAALCVGINYAGTDSELRGCLNDIADWNAFLQKRGGFRVDTLLEEQATKAAIVQHLTALVGRLRDGETGVFCYSGHGTWVPDMGGDEEDGRDEALVPFDFGADGANLLLDDELAAIFGGLAPQARLLFFSDSCHSGTVFRMVRSLTDERRVRFLPPAHFVKDAAMLAAVTRLYGQPAGRATSAPLRGVVCFSGCKDAEFSSDAHIGGRYCGAFTHHLMPSLGMGVQYGWSALQVHKHLRRYLPSWDFSQTPQLHAPKALRSAVLF
jgi:hypothetical protein